MRPRWMVVFASCIALVGCTAPDNEDSVSSHSEYPTTSPSPTSYPAPPPPPPDPGTCTFDRDKNIVKACPSGYYCAIPEDPYFGSGNTTSGMCMPGPPPPSPLWKPLRRAK